MGQTALNYPINNSLSVYLYFRLKKINKNFYQTKAVSRNKDYMYMSNIYLGGTGKTPLADFCSKNFKKKI